MLDDKVKELEALPEDELKKLKSTVTAAIKDMKFIPSPGPQTEAYFSEADILLFGGEPGGGKTGLLIGLAVNEHDRTMIVRKQFADLDGVIDNAKGILGTDEGFVGGTRPRYTKPDGGLIHFQGMAGGEDFDTSKQGTPHDLICVSPDTPVLMGDNTYKPIGKIKIGEMVQTLSGPRRVLNSFPSGLRDSVAITANGVTQIQSASHKLLTLGGWVCRDNIAFSPPSWICEPKEFGEYGIFFGLYVRACRALSQLHARPFDRQPLFDELVQAVLLLGDTDWLVSSADKGRVNQDNACEEIDGNDQVLSPHLLSLELWQGLLKPLHAMVGAARNTPHFSFSYDDFDAQKRSLLQDWMDRYLADFHLYDERIRAVLDSHHGLMGDQLYPLRLVDVGQHIPNGLPNDDVDKVQIYTCRAWSYAHPYRTGVCQSNLRTSLFPCQVAPLGEIELYDIEVEEVNHFITQGGFVNKNCVDEGAQLSENSIRMLMGWNRTKKKGQRCRMVIATNPPIDSVGDWLADFFGPWLNPAHPNPARFGELRWFIINAAGDSEEVDGPEIINIDGVDYYPHSRTYINSKLEDNPYIDANEYLRRLQTMPEPYRTMLTSGNFMLARKDADYQVIPTAWILAAQARWTPKPPLGMAMTSMAYDPAGGGRDSAELSIRYGGWFAPLISVQGAETADGSASAATIVKYRRDAAAVVVDCDGGYGGAVCQRLGDNAIEALKFKGSSGSTAKTKEGAYSFTNRRSEAWWKFREELDPDQEGGSVVALPPDPELRSDLAAPSWKLTARGIQVEPKVVIGDGGKVTGGLRKKLGRSPGKGDACVMNLSFGNKAAMRAMSSRTLNGQRPRVIMGHLEKRHTRH